MIDLSSLNPSDEWPLLNLLLINFKIIFYNYLNVYRIQQMTQWNCVLRSARDAFHKEQNCIEPENAAVELFEAKAMPWQVVWCDLTSITLKPQYKSAQQTWFPNANPERRGFL